MVAVALVVVVAVVVVAVVVDDISAVAVAVASVCLPSQLSWWSERPSGYHEGSLGLRLLHPDENSILAEWRRSWEGCSRRLRVMGEVGGGIVVVVVVAVVAVVVVVVVVAAAAVVVVVAVVVGAVVLHFTDGYGNVIGYAAVAVVLAVVFALTEGYFCCGVAFILLQQFERSLGW